MGAFECPYSSPRPRSAGADLVARVVLEGTRSEILDVPSPGPSRRSSMSGQGVGDLRDAESLTWAQLSAVSVSAALVTPPREGQRRNLKSPELWPRRETSSDHVGLVGRFLAVAPMLLQDGRSSQAPPVAHEDWWLDCVECELVGPASRRSPGGPVATGGAQSLGSTRGMSPAQPLGGQPHAGRGDPV